MGKLQPIQVQLLFLLLILCLPNSIFKLATSTNINIILCPEVEKEALLSFKQSLKDPSNILSSWNRRSSNSNCCTWKGVVFSNLTGNVEQLHLQSDVWYPTLQGKINPSLLQLKHLKYLDLSYNDFDQRIPSFVGSLTSLEYLNLSSAGFYGKTIGNLSRLHSLDLDTYPYSAVPLEVDRLEWLRGLSQLEHLHMSGLNLTKTGGQWMQVINTLPFLVDLRLRECSLSFNLDPLSELVNITSLDILDLSLNYKYYESSPIPNWIFRQSNLVFLDLRSNNFQGPIPTISNITKLQYIDLFYNHYLNSTNIPDWLYSCKDLEFLSMTHNSLQGSISNTAVGNLTSLTTLYLSANQLSGEIPRWIVNLRKLQILDLSNNMLQGEIPDMLGLCFLQDLRLSYNRLTGNLPMSVGRLSNLKVLDIRDKKMSGFVSESHLANLTKLTIFAASGNHFTLKLSSNWNPPFKLEILTLGSWNLGAGSDIPSWLKTQKSSLVELDLSNTGISGNVPAWFWGMRFLNLSHNNLSGSIPDALGNHLRRMYLNSNQFSGPLPQLGSSLLDINLSNNLFMWPAKQNKHNE